MGDITGSLHVHPCLAFLVKGPKKAINIGLLGDVNWESSFFFIFSFFHFT